MCTGKWPPCTAPARAPSIWASGGRSWKKPAPKRRPAGYTAINVISAVGTRVYYRNSALRTPGSTRNGRCHEHRRRAACFRIRSNDRAERLAARRLLPPGHPQAERPHERLLRREAARSRPRDKPLGMVGRRLGSSSRPPMPRKAPFPATPPCETPSPAAPPASPMTMPAIPRTPSLSSTLAAATSASNASRRTHKRPPARHRPRQLPRSGISEIGALSAAFPHSLRSSSAASKTKEEDASGQGANPPEKTIVDLRALDIVNPSSTAPSPTVSPATRTTSPSPSDSCTTCRRSPCAPGFSRGSSAPCGPAALPLCRSGSS